MSTNEIDIHKELKKYFGFDQFKGLQEKVIKSIVAKDNTFVIMPTGGGKSLCYQLPALIQEGTAIVVSPLIALMKNQVDAIRGVSSENGIAHVLNSSLTKTEINQVKKDITSGITKLLYVAPESLTKEEYVEFLQSVPTIDLEKLKHKGASMGLDFVALSDKQGDLSLSNADQEMILKFFTALKRLGAEFGYRSASEISTLLNNLNKIDGSMSIEERLDIAIMQKMLPKLHGSRTKLLPVLEMLGKLCLKESTLWEDYLARWKAYLKNEDKLDFKSESNIIYKLSFEKVIRMYSNALDNGFASYAEA